MKKTALPWVPISGYGGSSLCLNDVTGIRVSTELIMTEQEGVPSVSETQLLMY